MAKAPQRPSTAKRSKRSKPTTARADKSVQAFREALDRSVTLSRDRVQEVVDDCGSRGVRGLIVISGGFGERGGHEERESGQQAQRDLVHAARAHGMRIATIRGRCRIRNHRTTRATAVDLPASGRPHLYKV